MPSRIESHEGQTQLRINYTPSPKAKAFIEDPQFATAYFGPL